MGFFDDLENISIPGLPSNAEQKRWLRKAVGGVLTGYPSSKGKVARLMFPGGRGRPEPTQSSSFTDGQDEDEALLTYMSGAAYQAVQDRMANGQSTPSDMVTLRSIARLQTGTASNIEKQMFIQATQQSKFAAAYQSGELDEPEAFASSYDDWFQSMPAALQAQLNEQAAAGVGFGAGGTTEGLPGAPIDENLAISQAQQEQDARMQQMAYQRESLFGILNMLPQQARMQMIPMLLEDPTYRRMLFMGEDEEEAGSMFGGQGGSAAPVSSSGQPPLPKWMSP